jgi:hypothetical protein
LEKLAFEPHFYAPLLGPSEKRINDYSSSKQRKGAFPHEM